jgi:hypothetical protein
MSIGSPMRPHPSLAAVFAIGTAVGLGGCSLFAVTGPPERIEPAQAVRCTVSAVPPIVDGALAALGAGVTAYMSWNDPLDYRVLFPIGATALFASSMIYGAGQVGACRELAGR